MSRSLIPQLVLKDFHLMQTYIVFYLLGAVAGIVVAVSISGLLAANIAFTLVVSGMGGCGLHTLMQTVVEEKLKSTRPFIMSLPITFKEFTIAKLLVNLFVFGSVWLILSAASLYVTVNGGVLPGGSLPMMCMILLGIFLAYSAILFVCLTTQSQGYTILAIIICTTLTSAYLWTIVYWPSIGSYVYGSKAVWNTTVLAIMASQILASVAFWVLAIVFQFRKKDFL